MLGGTLLRRRGSPNPAACRRAEFYQRADRPFCRRLHTAFALPVGRFQLRLQHQQDRPGFLGAQSHRRHGRPVTHRRIQSFHPLDGYQGIHGDSWTRASADFGGPARTGPLNPPPT